MPGGNGIELLDEAKKLDLKNQHSYLLQRFRFYKRRKYTPMVLKVLFPNLFDLPSLIENLEWLCTDSQQKIFQSPSVPTTNEIKVSEKMPI